MRVWAGGRVCGATTACCCWMAETKAGPLGACAGVGDSAGAVIGAAAATGDS